jgi:hypothetical protein
MSNFITLYGVEREFFTLLRREYSNPSKRNPKREQEYFINFIGSNGSNIVGLSDYKMSDLYTSFDNFLYYWSNKESSDAKKQDEAYAIKIDAKYASIYYLFFFFYLLNGDFPENKKEVNLKLTITFEDIFKKTNDFFYSNEKVGTILTALTEALKDPDSQYYTYETLYESMAQILFEEHIRKSSEEPELMVIHFKNAMRALGIDKIENVLYVVAKDFWNNKNTESASKKSDEKSYVLVNNNQKPLAYFGMLNQMTESGNFGVFSYLGRRFRILPFTGKTSDIFESKKKALDLKTATVGDFINILISSFLLQKDRTSDPTSVVAKFLTTGLFTGVLYYVFKTDAPPKRKKAPIRPRRLN